MKKLIASLVAVAALSSIVLVAAPAQAATAPAKLSVSIPWKYSVASNGTQKVTVKSTVKNTGTLSLKDISLKLNIKAGGKTQKASCSWATTTLKPGKSVSCTKTYSFSKSKAKGWFTVNYTDSAFTFDASTGDDTGNTGGGGTYSYYFVS